MAQRDVYSILVENKTKAYSVKELSELTNYSLRATQNALKSMLEHRDVIRFPKYGRNTPQPTFYYMLNTEENVEYIRGMGYVV